MRVAEANIKVEVRAREATGEAQTKERSIASDSVRTAWTGRSVALCSDWFYKPVMATAAGINLQSRVTDLYGVGPERAAQLARLKIFTVGDLLLHRPHRYEERRNAQNIRDLALKQPALVRGKVVALGIKRYRKGMRSVFELILDDGTARLHCQWWDLPFMESYFNQGDEVVAYGKPKSLKPRTMDHPETEVIEAGEELSIHMNRIVPIYPLTEGLPQRWLRSLIWRTLPRFVRELAENGFNQPVTGLPARDAAIQAIHFPN